MECTHIALQLLLQQRAATWYVLSGSALMDLCCSFQQGLRGPPGLPGPLGIKVSACLSKLEMVPVTT